MEVIDNCSIENLSINESKQLQKSFNDIQNQEEIINSNNDNNILNKEIEIINNNNNNSNNSSGNNNSENSTEIDIETNSNDNTSEIDSTPSSPNVFSSSCSSSFSNLGSCISASTGTLNNRSSSASSNINSGLSLQQQIQKQTKKKVAIEGELIKRGHIFPTWRTRWFKIENGFLLYFKSKEEPEPIDRIPLRGSRVAKKPFMNDRPHTFELISTTMRKVFLLQAKDVNELDFWMDEITKENEFSRSLYSRTIS